MQTNKPELKYPTKLTKIVCTIGPASWDTEVMRTMIANGMNVARINAAFADRKELQRVEELVRGISPDVAMMLDVKGPEVRMNKFEQALELNTGDIIEIGSSAADKIYPANHPDLYTQMEVGQRILVGDGDVELEVVSLSDKGFSVKVNYGKVLKPGKALNFPGKVLNETPLTEKDMDLLDFIRGRDWEFVSASFIRTAKDAQHIKSYLGDSRTQLIAKIEDADGVANIREILQVVDGVMIARGGLGVELGIEKNPAVIRLLAKESRLAGKPVIMATQMLESMTSSPVPTRAEANDVATAMYLGVDAVMLSGESSAGSYPIESVEFLSKVAMEIEPTLQPEDLEMRTDFSLLDTALGKAAFEAIKRQGDIKFIVAFSEKGRIARLLTSYMLAQPIYAIATHQVYANQQLTLSRGVKAAFTITDPITEKSVAMESVDKLLRENSLVKSGDKYLVLGKLPGTIDKTNVFEIVTAQ